jgi:hypothetical protein
MIDELLAQDRELVRARINGETARIPWRDLQRFFAAGKVLHVAAGLDLVEVACAVHEDDIERVKRWTEASQLGPVADDRARAWLDSEAAPWAVVVKPWVLVQESD